MFSWGTCEVESILLVLFIEMRDAESIKYQNLGFFLVCWFVSGERLEFFCIRIIPHGEGLKAHNVHVVSSQLSEMGNLTANKRKYKTRICATLQSSRFLALTTLSLTICFIKVV